ncbi:Nudix family hydrolase [Endozoicomonas sp. SESOKO1]|uniref:Nudix family hydrolase n=1 Tax=Endozoicomonas sp. SESOKO1 TaxID=2828742 RepID=UPI0021479DFB|nr:Nudix family hydrolase [Endozoicomonas sp. SESOKO1]
MVQKAEKAKSRKIDNRNVVHVAVAVILGDDGRVLLAKRPEDKHMGGLWEFPGGKVEPGEDIKLALNRELREELDIDVSTFSPLIKIRHDYPETSVLLDTWVVSGIQGEPKGNEGQVIQWVEKGCLNNYEFPEANKVILRALQLPDRYMITGHFKDKETLFNSVSAALDNGIHLIQFRAHWLEVNDYLRLAQELSSFVLAAGGTLIIKGDFSLLSESWCQGLHLTSHQLGLPVKPEKRYSSQLLVASCHNKPEIKAAEAMEVDFITLSPVRATASHPEASPLGLDRAEMLTTVAKVPVFWLGGMSPEDTSLARQMGAQGIAAIQAFRD